MCRWEDIETLSSKWVSKIKMFQGLTKENAVLTPLIDYSLFTTCRGWLFTTFHLVPTIKFCSVGTNILVINIWDIA